MPVTELDVQTPDGVLDAYLHTPDGAAASASPLPVVVFYPDAGGVRDTMHQMAQRLADEGYAVAVVNYYYRQGKVSFDLNSTFADPDARTRIMAALAGADGALVARDTALLLDALATRGDVRADRVGVVGYCRGGNLAFTLAGAVPRRVAVAASIHGGSIATDAPNSPHLNADQIQGALYFAVATDDPHCTLEQQELLTTALDKAGVRYELDRYDAAHGFAVPDHTAPYDPAAAELHWQRITALFARELPR
ncbi:dienelactone hydrolase family protein [Frankia sp. AgPm24]|uniref:dienelactone hydrolase family protein n=1 Tax=Frankia sp. AgPm24 TaxID=631128 RepID=UPI00200E23AD|nr:dienelactone hydrolase family protein [Frankia sp. AgPm24]MCK9924847.1 dienelactone hydrolase family protein [Frankia sp. AgPm24]